MNMEKPCRVDVLQALDNLYHAEDPANKEKASLWLMQLHSSVSVRIRRRNIPIKAHLYRCMHGQ